MEQFQIVVSEIQSVRQQMASLNAQIIELKATSDAVSNQPKEKLEDNNIAADVIMADRTEDGCCAKVSRCLSELTGREAAFTFSWSGSVTATAKLE